MCHRRRCLQCLWTILCFVFAEIQLWFLGQSDVSWSDKPEGRPRIFDYEVYMQDCLILWGKGKLIGGQCISYFKAKQRRHLSLHHLMG